MYCHNVGPFGNKSASHVSLYYCYLCLLLFIYRDFEISYQLPQSHENGKRPDMFLSLTSDFDLDAAFMSSSLPFLSLKIEPVTCLGNYLFTKLSV